MFYVGADQVGSPRIVIRASDAAIVRRVDYDAYGVERNATGTFDLPIGYAGGLRDAATGLVRFGMRDFFDPAAGRFTARDPSFFRGSPENLYTYANGNPVTQRDPTGLVCGAMSGFLVAGGGVQICRDNKIEGADWSVCLEGGLGVGGGPEVDALGGAADTGPRDRRRGDGQARLDRRARRRRARPELLQRQAGREGVRRAGGDRCRHRRRRVSRLRPERRRVRAERRGSAASSRASSSGRGARSSRACGPPRPTGSACPGWSRRAAAAACR